VVSEPGTGEVLLTPVMRWLLERGGGVDGFSQSMVLRVPAGLGLDRLTTSVRTLLDHHDVLLRTSVVYDWLPRPARALPGATPPQP